MAFNLNIETPQEVLARIAAARQKALAKAGPQEAAKINLNRGLDLLFGNPQARAAEEKAGAVRTALDTATKEGKQLDLTPDELQLRKLELVRNSLETIDPQQALAIDDQIRQIKIQNLERAKLNQEVKAGDISLQQANKRYAFNPDTLQSEEIDLSQPDGFKKAQDLRAQGRLVTKSEDALVNLFNAERSRKWNEQQKELDRQAKLQEASLKKGGNTGITLSRKTQLQGSIEANTQLMDLYRKAADQLNDPSMLRVRNRIKNFSMSVTDFAKQPGVSQEDLDAYRRLQGLVASTMGAANRLIKERSGAAVTEQEWQRLKKEIPLVEDNPIDFMTKMNIMYSTLATSTRRAKDALLADDFTILTDDTGTFSKPSDVLFNDKAFQEAGLRPTGPQSGDLTVQGPTIQGGRTKPAMTADDILKRYGVK